MPDLQARDVKLIEYQNEAYGKEKQLETALEAHIQMTSRAAYKKRLQKHLRETKAHAREVQRRIKKLGGKAEFQDEAEEIATYSAIVTLAETVGDPATAKFAKRIRREEERMRDYLGGLIGQLTKAVATEEIPAAERRTGRRRRGAPRRTNAGARRPGAARSRTATRRRTTAARSRAGGRARTSTRRTGARASGGRSTARRSTA